MRNLPIQLSTAEIRQLKQINSKLFDASVKYEGLDALQKLKMKRLPCRSLSEEDEESEELKAENESFKISVELKNNYVIEGIECFKCSVEGKNYKYFLYQHYDYDLASYQLGAVKSKEFKMIIKDYIKALAELHKQNIIHSNINLDNLVICQKKGYITGFLRKTVLDIKQAKKKDQDDLVNCVKQLFFKHNRTIPLELNMLLTFIEKIDTLDNAWEHPYFLSYMDRIKYFDKANRAIKMSTEQKRSYLSFLIEEKYGDGLMHGWTFEVENQKMKEVLHWCTKEHKVVDQVQYSHIVTEFVRFCKNCWKHIDIQGSLLDHCYNLEQRLDKIIPGFVCILHYGMIVAQI